MQISVVIVLEVFNSGNRKSVLFSSVSAVAFKNAKQFEQQRRLPEGCGPLRTTGRIFSTFEMVMSLLPVKLCSAGSLEAS